MCLISGLERHMRMTPTLNVAQQTSVCPSVVTSMYACASRSVVESKFMIQQRSGAAEWCG